jgi:hypothetical protein
MSESPWVHVDNQSFLIDVFIDRRTFRLYRKAIVAHGNHIVRRTSSIRSLNRLARTEKRHPKATIRKISRSDKKKLAERNLSDIPELELPDLGGTKQLREGSTTKVHPTRQGGDNAV